MLKSDARIMPPSFVNSSAESQNLLGNGNIWGRPKAHQGGFAPWTPPSPTPSLVFALVQNPKLFWGMGTFGDTPNPARVASPLGLPSPTLLSLH